MPINDGLHVEDAILAGLNNKRVCEINNNLRFLLRNLFGPLLLRPDARYIGKEIASELKRNRIVLYWPNLNADIEYIYLKDMIAER